MISPDYYDGILAKLCRELLTDTKMTIGVSHDLDTGNVVLVDAAAQTIYELSPSKAHQLASHLRTAAKSGVSVLVIATANDGRQVKIGGTAEHAISMGEGLDRNAELAMAIRQQKSLRWHRSALDRRMV